jgi:hypothetical protein
MNLSVSFRLLDPGQSAISTPWTGDQLIARTLLTAPGDCDDDGEFGMNGFGRGNGSSRKRPVPTSLCPPQIPLAILGREPGAVAVGSQRLTAAAGIGLNIIN